MQDSFTIPALPITNAFIRLFFERFAPQAPVLHRPTLDTSKDLLPALLAMVVVTGAIYFRLRSTRRFAVLALDRVRRHLQLAIEDDNTLMRDPMIIFAAALICYTGLWCGNKRAFELAEGLRGAVVTYIRHLGTADSNPHDANAGIHPRIYEGQQDELEAQWKQWTVQESRKWLCWFVYTLDCQYPSLLNIAPMMSATEVSSWDCPSGEEFWTARSARHWKSLLGSASVPPSRSFAAAMIPFTMMCYECSDHDDEDNHYDSDHITPPLNLNAWSYFLVMMTLQGRIFRFGEERLLIRSLTVDKNHFHTKDDQRRSESGLYIHDHFIKQRLWLESALSLWSRTYASQLPPPQQSDSTSLYFHHASAVLGRLGRANLNVPITDLQEAIGKGGNAMIALAMVRLSDWVLVDPRKAEDTILEAVETIERILWFQQRREHDQTGRPMNEGSESWTPHHAIASPFPSPMS